MLAARAKDVTGKLLCCFFIILLFVVSGYEPRRFPRYTTTSIRISLSAVCFFCTVAIIAR